MTASFDPASVDLPTGHHIAGRFLPASGGIPLRRPSDGAAHADCPVADADCVDRAVEAAHAALAASGWGRCTPRDRTRALQRWADLMEAEAAPLARLEAVSSTRPVAQLAAGDIAVTAEQIRFFAELADKECSELAPTAEGALGMTVAEPYGVIAAITPWNFPISMAGWKLAPALAAGNAVVIKPSELTPFSTVRLAELAVRAGIPEGIVNVVLGDGPTTGAALTGHPGIGKVSFTGSTAAGAAIMENAARTGIRPVTLELGGKSPQIVFADADLGLAADAIARSILANAGQACVAGSRVIVEAPVAEQLTEMLAARLARIRPGPTWAAETDYAPIVSERQIARIEGIVGAGIAAGAELRCGAARFDREGYFYAPTLLAGVRPDNPAELAEIFGPVLTLQSFASEEEALRLADHPVYGLCAGLYTRDLSRALRVMRGLQSGTVWVNRYGRSRDHILPTGGYKSSGIGKDLGRAAFHACRREKTVLIDIARTE
ncbi:aldehyde dehydrogenase family protein [Paralimibaculum aggregatum]|uniref:Aldehyde dehydrogenase family protein n=1 Tax=Paralimibaculum aggregatum TaxID=3036245 RepID=A0ABQ6LKV9_9RHOB|nr:aldehyde dehydrogenase family protein [Limibaculum sp. NKW23]GMG83051.1 aldehyde dehydrogenase family protein [Limibaculum sp. NKW23]